MMNQLINKLYDRISKSKAKILIAGDVLIDEYHIVDVDRLSPEGPFPIFKRSSEHTRLYPGGAGNVANQLVNFGVDISLASFSSPSFENVLNPYKIRHIKSDNPIEVPLKQRFVSNNIPIARIDIEKDFYGCNSNVMQNNRQTIISKTREQKYDVTVFSDYGKGFFDTTQKSYLNDPGYGYTIVDPKAGSLEQWKGCSLFKPNFQEAKQFTGSSDPLTQCQIIKERVKCDSVVVTNSDKNVYGIDSKEYFFCLPNTINHDVSSVVGAGDCFTALLALCISYKFSIFESVSIAQYVSSKYVTLPFSDPFYFDDLVSGFISNPSLLSKRDPNKKLVFTNGCFDLLHENHLQLLEFAKLQGDKLVVAINSDNSVKKIKGEDRPFNNEKHRIRLLEAMRVVDYVVLFNENTPYEVISEINPDVLVKGSEYNKETVIGADLVSNVVIAPFFSDLSTSSLIEKLSFT